MPILPLPPDATALGAGDLSVVTDDDVKQLLPAFVRQSDDAPVRDAIAAALRVIVLEYGRRAERAAARVDVLRAEDDDLIGVGQDHDVFASDGESNDSLRSRILDVRALVTPTAIMAAVNSILAPHTSVLAQYGERVQDAWFVGDGTSDWHSFVWDSTSSMSPYYPDRFYEDDATENGGRFRPQSNPGGARVFNDVIGRLFYIRIPALSGLDDGGAFASGVDLLNGRFYVGDGSSADVSNAIRSVPATARTVFDAIVSTVNRIKGHGIRWALFEDPKLKE